MNDLSDNYIKPHCAIHSSKQFLESAPRRLICRMRRLRLALLGDLAAAVDAIQVPDEVDVPPTLP